VRADRGERRREDYATIGAVIGAVSFSVFFSRDSFHDIPCSLWIELIRKKAYPIPSAGPNARVRRAVRRRCIGAVIGAVSFSVFFSRDSFHDPGKTRTDLDLLAPRVERAACEAERGAARDSPEQRCAAEQDGRCCELPGAVPKTRRESRERPRTSRRVSRGNSRRGREKEKESRSWSR
jgi:hypothetical protein